MFTDSIFRIYDIRGIYPTEVNPEVFEALGRAFAQVTKAKTVAVGRDVRLSGPELQQSLTDGLLKSGVSVVDIGVVSTEMLYFAVANYSYDGGIIVTASHNPAEYNGAKFIGSGAEALDPYGTFAKLKELAQKNQFIDASKSGQLSTQDILDDYLEKCLSLVDQTLLKPIKIVANPNFGAMSSVIPALRKKVSFEAILLNDQPDGSFPKGRPDPMRPENRTETSQLIIDSQPAFGVAWDADADRVFFFDETGQFIDGYFTLALLAQIFLDRYPGEKIVHEPRQIWAVDDVIEKLGGQNILSRAGHLFMKQKLQQAGAIFGGEMSGHFFFRDFYGVDSGLIGFLLIWQLVSEGHKLSDLVRPFREKYFISGEINFSVNDVKAVMTAIKNVFGGQDRPELGDLELAEDRQWRANVRPSDNEPLFRINVEAKSQELCDQKTKELTATIQPFIKNSS